MKRLHVSVNVTDVAKSIAFYTTLFDAQPTVRKDDYAKWMLDDPRVNFAITSRERKPGHDHFGIQVETEGELAEVYGRLQQAERPIVDQGDTVCCYAKSTKQWIADPDGVAWEAFLTHDDATVYADETYMASPDLRAALCCDTDEKSDACCITN